MKEVGAIAEDTAVAIVQQLVGGKTDKAAVAAAVKAARKILGMDATFWATVALVLFLAIVFYLKVPGMIGRSLDSRAAKIANELEEARKLREESQQLLAEFQRKRKEAEKEAGEIVEAARREAASLVQDAHKKSEEYVARRTAMARAEDRPGRA